MRLKPIYLILLFWVNIGFAQDQQKIEMQKLNFLVGDWVGTSSTYENGILKNQIPAYEKIQFKVDGYILTIDLHSSGLKLHTVIYYDTTEQTYYYNPFYKKGSAKYPAKLENNTLIVTPTKDKRFIFEITEDGKFREHGEVYKDGSWQMYFEDIFEKQ